MGSPWTHRRLTAELAARGLLVISVDYRRAPKHRFPGAVDGAAFALGWAGENLAEYGGDPDRLLVGGDSAGANLAAAIPASGAPGAADVAVALLFYGVYDYDPALPALSGLLGGEDAASQLYLDPAGFDGLRGDPRLSPEGHVAGFPPTWLTGGGAGPAARGVGGVHGPAGRGVGAARTARRRRAPYGYLQLPTHPAHDEGLSAVVAFLRRTGLLPTDPENA